MQYFGYYVEQVYNIDLEFLMVTLSMFGSLEIADAYLGPCQTTMMKFFCENS